WNDALPLLEAAGRGELVARICRDIAYKYVWENRSAEARQYVDRGLRAVGDEPSSSRCRLLAINSYAHSVAGELAEAEEVNDRALAMAETLGDEALLAGEVLLSRLYLFQHSFRFGKMAQTGERAVPLLRRLNRSWDLSNALGGTLLAWALQGRFDLLTAHIDEAVTLAVREGDLGNQFHAGVVRSFVELSQGNVRGGRDGYRDARAFAREAEFPWWSIAQALQGVGELQMGEWDTARATLDDAISQAVTGTWRGFEPAARLLVLVYAGDGAAPAELERLIPELPVVGQVGRSGAWTMTAPVLESALLLGRRDVAAGL
ncbi:MAG: hypothetical protein GWO02_22685, partial [Gammaproteobacteria bacterium]|nr:hypothetical protein [Gammaproteobacteria bacterium]